MRLGESAGKFPRSKLGIIFLGCAGECGWAKYSGTQANLPLTYADLLTTNDRATKLSFATHGLFM